MSKYFVSRALLIQTAADLVEEVGVDRATLREVARRAGISHGAPRHQFPSWNALLAEVAKAMVGELDRELDFCWVEEGGPRAVLLAVAETYVGFSRRRPAAFALIHRHDLLDVQGGELRKTTGAWISAVARRLEVAGARHDDAAVYALWSSIHGYAVLAGGMAPDAVMREVPAQRDVLALAIDRALADKG